MATPDCIESIFALFGSVPYKTPADFDLDGCLTVWEAVFADVTDKDLGVAAFAFIKANQGGFWPVPGAVRSHLPQPEGADPEWSEAFARLADVARVRGSGKYKRMIKGVLTPTGIAEGSGFEGFFPRSPAAEKATLAGIDAIGGWTTYCMSEPGDQTVRAAFRDAFRATLATEQRRKDDASVRALLGQAGVGDLEGPGFLQLIVGGRS